MNKRKTEFALVFAIVAAVVMFVSSPHIVEPEPAPVEARVSETPASGKLGVQVKVRKLGISEDARWVMSTAADSYAPRLKVETMWESSSKSAISQE